MILLSSVEEFSCPGIGRLGNCLTFSIQGYLSKSHKILSAKRGKSQEIVGFLWRKVFHVS